MNTKPKLSERLLARIWQRAPDLPGGLVTQEGEWLKVLYPGRASSQAGPDFRDALLMAADGKLIRGDVELHLRAGDWRSHGHHRDPNYNSVVLHVALEPGATPTSPQRSGAHVPVLSLAPLWSSQASLGEEQKTPPPVEEVGRLLDRAGDLRFYARSRGFRLELGWLEPEEVLYRSLMEALGYAGNRKPFRELAQRVPMRVLSRLSGEPKGTRVQAVRALLLRASGLSPSGASPLDRGEMRALRRHLPSVGSIPASRWNLFRVRPGNHPLQRIEGAARLVAGHLSGGLLQGILGLARQAQDALKEGLMAPPYIGGGRAQEMMVSVVLPFLHCWAGVAGDAPLSGLCVQMYRRCPRSPDNEITREMRRLLEPQGGADLFNSARRQQGSTPLYRALYRGVETPADFGYILGGLRAIGDTPNLVQEMEGNPNKQGQSNSP